MTNVVVFLLTLPESRTASSTCLHCLEGCRSVCEEWVVPCISDQFHDVACLTIDSIFTGQFCVSVCESVNMEIMEPLICWHFVYTCILLIQCNPPSLCLTAKAKSLIVVFMICWVGQQTTVPAYFCFTKQYWENCHLTSVPFFISPGYQLQFSNLLLFTVPQVFTGREKKAYNMFLKKNQKNQNLN